MMAVPVMRTPRCFLFSILCVSLLILSGLAVTPGVSRFSVPRDASPGYVVGSVAEWGQGVDLRGKYSHFFTLHPNGEMVVNEDISSLTDTSVSVVIASKHSAWKGVIYIDITNPEDNQILMFQQMSYTGHVDENSRGGSVVEGLANIAVKPNHKHSDRTIQYRITGGSDFFELIPRGSNQSSGVSLQTTQPLDREQTSEYTLTIEAAIDNTTAAAQAKITVIVDDENDHTPIFEKTVYSVTIKADTPAHTTILSVTAKDPDSGRISYVLTNERDIFAINRTTGAIVLTSRPHLQSNNYVLTVFAEDDDKKRSQTVIVRVNVVGSLNFDLSNDDVSQRLRRNVQYIRPIERDVEENMIGDLMDLPNDYNERFSFKEPAPDMFTIHPVTGVVRLKEGKRLDYESQKEISFVVIITRTDDIAARSEQPIKIRLRDVNDEVPRFVNLPMPFLATISSSAAPGTSVYQLVAQDDDEDSLIRYVMESGGENRFQVDVESGVVRTVGNQAFRLGKEYEIGVSAVDTKAMTQQKSAMHSLKILVGHRDPQFFETLYEASVPETASVQYKITEIKAFSHQNYPITYELTTEAGTDSNEFAIDQNTGAVDLLQQLDYEKDPEQYHLKVKAVENGRPPRTSTVNLIINLIDENDNTPMFPLSQYIVQGIAETVGVGVDIIQVVATDRDSVTNSQLTYTVNNPHFKVQTLNNIGYIRTAKRLDYDRTPSHTYNFTITATDNGTPARKASAQVRVTLTNVNDEVPVFMKSIDHVQVSEDASPNTVVHVIQAFDPDGDDVTYSFRGRRLSEGPFNIIPVSGLITLVGQLDKSKVSYKLHMVATDNGGCCGGTTSRSSEGLVIVEVKDINNNAPRFHDCATYYPMVLENEDVGTSVFRVSAIDYDTGANGNVTYSLVRSSDHSNDQFYIEPITGVIHTADRFNREAKSGVTDLGVTVKAEDNGRPSLAGFCTFRVKIGDKNDHPPVFDFAQYSTSIEEGSVIGKRVLQVYATDKDAGNNGNVMYKMKVDPSGFFTINHHSGWITVARAMSGRTFVELVVEAEDLGSPPKRSTVHVDIRITQTVNAYPHWVRDYSTQVIELSENAPINTIVERLKAVAATPVATDPLMHYRIMPGETVQQNGEPRSFHLRISNDNEMLLMTYRALDFETTPRYTLTIKAANRATVPLHNSTRITIVLIDENDEIPQFVGLDENGRYPGSVAENLTPGAEVITVTAQDRDEFPAYKKISYRIKQSGHDYSKFLIDRESGVVTTAAMFDREAKKEYYITVVAEDGAKSDRPNHYPPGTPNQGEAEVQIRITDKNDNAPYFKKLTYMARVPENTDFGTIVISVTAEDYDKENQLTYSITGGNIGNAFEVVPDLGEIKVRGMLDYEKGPRVYRLKYRVFDDKFSNLTTVVIHIMDVNDNPPEFDSTIYNITDMQEEEPGIHETSPKYLLTVRAVDPDTDRDSNIRYSLSGQFAADGTFRVNRATGEIFLTRSLDRDYPRGRPVWNFNVLAHDEVGSGQPSLTGYAEVRVMPRDINDNAPIFDRNRLVGKVAEHSNAGMSVLTVIATDADRGNNGSVTYSLKQVPMKGSTGLFSIDSSTGLILTTLNNALDRETQPEYTVIVKASDRGYPSQSSSATVTILIDDINDNVPRFTQKIYTATMSENFPKGASVTSVSATDADSGENAKLTYTLREQDREYFEIILIEATNTGVLKVYKPVDFEELYRPFFNLTVYVRDANMRHVDMAHIEIKITDYNDNAPKFNPSTQKVVVFENVTVLTSLARFTASDIDMGINRQFDYVIDQATDPARQFGMDTNGLVRSVKALDRETESVHRIHILAIDKGTPAQTGTGTLIVTLKDVNDNFPTFAEDFRPVVYENEEAFKTIVQISAVDRDTAANGPPFEFWLPCGGGCPCHDNPTCGLFGFKFIPGGGRHGYGTGVVTSLKKFDRERQKQYLMPIIMKDSGHPPISGTNTLTITIGDRNDNKHYPGHKNIFVYNYKGLFEDVPLGNVYAEDKDDWDVTDKTFLFVDSGTSSLFNLDADSGQLSMNGRLKEGVYNFEVKVFDRVYNREVVSTVTVTVQEIGDEPIISSGSLRLTGITAQQFVERPKVGAATNSYGQSHYDILRSLIAKKLDTPVSNVDIFTVRDHPTMPDTVDVRYSAHGSPYYRPSRIDGLMNEDKKEFEDVLGIRLLMVPIDECLKEICESGGCSNRLVTTGEPLLVNTNSTTLIGITAYIEARCECAAREFSSGQDIECRPDSCLNGGTCHQHDYGFSCTCYDQFDGSRCQQTRHSFHGNGWAWYAPLSQCEDSHTSIEFVTQQDNGLIFYNGPTHELASGEDTDFILLELRSGYPVLRLNHGSGEVKLEIDGHDKRGIRQLQKLNDGVWHRVDIFRRGKEARLMVDLCKTSTIVENENQQTSFEDRSSCEVIAETPGENMYINVNTPLQLGGRSRVTPYPRNVMDLGFDGCVKNLIHNGQLYDLHVGRVGQHANSKDGCDREDDVCGVNDINGHKCGVNGKCVGSFLFHKYECQCDPGWRGPKCIIPTTTKDFGSRSFIEWDFKEEFYVDLEDKLYKTSLHVMFRTRQSSGLLLKAQNAQKSEYLLIEIIDECVRFRYNLGTGEQQLMLSHINVSDGQWHTVRVDRIGQWAVMKLDSGEGRFFNETFGAPGGHLQIRVSQRSMFAGGNVRFPSIQSEPLVDMDYADSCMNDIRYNEEWLPMDESQNSESRAAEVMRSRNIMDGCKSTACLQTFCSHPLVCVDLWRYAECSCSMGQRLAPPPEICVNINECFEDEPCYNGECIDEPDGFYCNCAPGYSGTLCDLRQEAVVAYMSTGAILIILICALVLLLLVLLFIIYSRRRRPESYAVGMDPDDDVRENMINYNEEGVGEEDQDAYDINRLKKPVENGSMKKPPVDKPITKAKDRPQYGAPPGVIPNIGPFIDSRLDDADKDPNAPPHDSVREYAYEGGGSDAGSISSLGSTSDNDEQNYNYLNNWGPRFSKLADMYGGAED